MGIVHKVRLSPSSPSSLPPLPSSLPHCPSSTGWQARDQTRQDLFKPGIFVCTKSNIRWIIMMTPSLIEVAQLGWNMDWIGYVRTLRPIEHLKKIFSLSSTVGLSTSSSSSSSASLSSFSSSASGLATPARTTSPPQCSDHSTDRDIGQSRSVTMMMIGNDDNPFRDQKSLISGFSPPGGARSCS